MLKPKLSFTQILLINAVMIKKKIILHQRGEFKGLKNVENFSEYNIEASALHADGRTPGLSGFARLRNADTFLEICLRSHINFLDELILVDNNSTDDTEKICLKLMEEFPDKVKYYRYAPEVSKIATSEYDMQCENSVRDLSYYCNWVLSKTTYSHVMKVDDDHLMNQEAFASFINTIDFNAPDVFYSFSGYNVKKVGNTFKLLKRLPLAGLYGDHGIAKVNGFFYFFRDERYENLLYKKMKLGPTIYSHLKCLKPSLGAHNYGERLARNVPRLIHEVCDKEIHVSFLSDLYLNGL